VGIGPPHLADLARPAALPAPVTSREDAALYRERLFPLSPEFRFSKSGISFSIDCFDKIALTGLPSFFSVLFLCCLLLTKVILSASNGQSPRYGGSGMLAGETEQTQSGMRIV